jgi:predicted Zn-dependent peptidase
VIHHEAAQAKIAVYVPTEDYEPARSAVYRALHEYLGGQAGLVFQEVREARGLAYAAHAGHSAGAQLSDQNLIWASAASRPDRSAEAIAVMLGLLREFPIQAHRFERARSSAIERMLGGRVRFRGYGLTAEGWRLRGQSEDPRPGILADLRGLTCEDLADFVAPLDQAAIAVVCVGDTTRMDMAALARLGTVELRTLDELVVY